MLGKLVRLVLLLSLMLTSCIHTKPKPRSSIVQKQKAFLFIEATHMGVVCQDNVCLPQTAMANGSGFLIRKLPHEGMLGITAAHLCDSPFQNPFFTELRVNTHDGKKYKAEIVKSLTNIDICVLFIPKMKDVIALKVSPTPPQVGDPTHTVSAPLSIFRPGAILLFHGHYSGLISLHSDGHTIPTAPGSSGSPILNARGEIVGMTSAVMIGFNHFCISPRYKYLKEVIDLAFKVDLTKPEKDFGL